LRRNYSTIGFLQGNRLKVVWKKRGDFSETNRKLPSTEFADYMYDGLNFGMEGKHADALAAFEEAAELCKHDFPIAEFFIGQTASKLGDTTKMLRHYLKALELDPYQLEARMDLSTYYSKVGETEKAKQLSREILQIAPWLRK
jgi:tetratricopeptide (TPR) repeat protein